MDSFFYKDYGANLTSAERLELENHFYKESSAAALQIDSFSNEVGEKLLGLAKELKTLNELPNCREGRKFNVKAFEKYLSGASRVKEIRKEARSLIAKRDNFINRSYQRIKNLYGEYEELGVFDYKSIYINHVRRDSKETRPANLSILKRGRDSKQAIVKLLSNLDAGGVGRALRYIVSASENGLVIDSYGREVSVDSVLKDWGNDFDPNGKLKDGWHLCFSMQEVPNDKNMYALRLSVEDTMGKHFPFHKYVMVAHTHQNNPHIHVIVNKKNIYTRKRLHFDNRDEIKAFFNELRNDFKDGLNMYGGLNYHNAYKFEKSSPSLSLEKDLGFKPSKNKQSKFDVYGAIDKEKKKLSAKYSAIRSNIKKSASAIKDMESKKLKLEESIDSYTKDIDRLELELANAIQNSIRGRTALRKRLADLKRSRRLAIKSLKEESILIKKANKELAKLEAALKSVNSFRLTMVGVRLRMDGLERPALDKELEGFASLKQKRAYIDHIRGDKDYKKHLSKDSLNTINKLDYEVRLHESLAASAKSIDANSPSMFLSRPSSSFQFALRSADSVTNMSSPSSPSHAPAPPPKPKPKHFQVRSLSPRSKEVLASLGIKDNASSIIHAKQNICRFLRFLYEYKHDVGSLDENMSSINNKVIDGLTLFKHKDPTSLFNNKKALDIFISHDKYRQILESNSKLLDKILSEKYHYYRDLIKVHNREYRALPRSFKIFHSRQVKQVTVVKCSGAFNLVDKENLLGFNIDLSSTRSLSSSHMSNSYSYSSLTKEEDKKSISKPLTKEELFRYEFKEWYLLFKNVKEEYKDRSRSNIDHIFSLNDPNVFKDTIEKDFNAFKKFCEIKDHADEYLFYRIYEGKPVIVRTPFPNKPFMYKEEFDKLVEEVGSKVAKSRAAAAAAKSTSANASAVPAPKAPSPNNAISLSKPAASSSDKEEEKPAPKALTGEELFRYEFKEWYLLFKNVKEEDKDRSRSNIDHIFSLNDPSVIKDTIEKDLEAFKKFCEIKDESDEYLFHCIYTNKPSIVKTGLPNKPFMYKEEFEKLKKARSNIPRVNNDKDKGRGR